MITHLHCDAVAVVLHVLRGTCVDTVRDPVAARGRQRQRIVINGPQDDLIAVLCFAVRGAVALGSRLKRYLSGIL